jgi:quercetin dioxygenase-like cupin family protein
VEKFRLDAMTRGWFVGDFAPAVLRTSAAETAVQRYAQGDYEPPHYHARATEITLIVSGEAEMNGKKIGAGEIVLIQPGEVTDFRALTEVTTVVVKVPSVRDDKFPAPGC